MPQNDQAARALDGNRRSLSPEWRAEAIGRFQRVTKAEWQQLTCVPLR